MIPPSSMGSYIYERVCMMNDEKNDEDINFMPILVSACRVGNNEVVHVGDYVHEKGADYESWGEVLSIEDSGKFEYMLNLKHDHLYWTTDIEGDYVRAKDCIKLTYAEIVQRMLEL
jgi:hypothetical protein